MSDILARLVDIPAAIAALPLHEPIVPSNHGLDDPPAAGPDQRVHPDHFSIRGTEAITDLLASVAPTLPCRDRPPLGLLLFAAALSRDLPASRRVVLVGAGMDDPLADLLIGLNRDRPLTRVVLNESGADMKAGRPDADLHHVVVAPPRFTFADARPARVGLLYLADVAMRDAHWSWFHPERLIETIDASLEHGGTIIIAGADRQNIQRAIVDAFIRLHEGRYRIAYQGRFGCGAGQARPTLILRKLRDLDATIVAARREVTRALFADPVTLSHENDRNFVTKPAIGLQLRSGHEPMASHVMVPARAVTIDAVGDDRYRRRFPGYFAARYLAPEIRLNRLRDGVVFSRLPTCIASPGGSLLLTSYLLEEYLSRAGVATEERARINGRRDQGNCYRTDFSLTPSILRDGIPEITNYLEQPVFYFGIRWIGMYGHFLHEACPTISLWRQHLKPAGVKLLVNPFSKRWQWDALRSLGVGDDDMLPFAPNATLMCRELWFSNSFEDARSNVLPEIGDFADHTDLSDRTRKRTLRLYAARTDTPNRRLVNEAELIERLGQEGFISFVGSEHTLAEQIAMFQQADIIVGKDGTNLTNIIFGDRDTLLVEILGEEFFDPLYMRIANTRGLHYDHVLASTVRGSGRYAESVVDVDAVVATIERAAMRRAAARPNRMPP